MILTTAHWIHSAFLDRTMEGIVNEFSKVVDIVSAKAVVMQNCNYFHFVLLIVHFMTVIFSLTIIE